MSVNIYWFWRLHRRMKRTLLPLTLFVVFAILGSVTLVAQTSGRAYTPAVNSPERKAILDALRADSSDKTIFKVHFLRVHDGWAWVDTTPLDPNTKQPTAEGGTNLLRLENDKWQVLDLSRVPSDPNDPLGDMDASPAFVRNVRRTYKGCPADIFPKPSH